MSSFRSAAFDPVSGTVREAYWIDDHFGKHRYGVRFDDGGPVYDPKDVELRAAGAEITRLRSLNAELVEALSELLFLSRTDAENSVDAYERVAERFYAETGMLAPGKDQPAELPTPTFEERQEAYSAWLAGFKHRAREVLSRARAKEDT